MGKGLGFLCYSLRRKQMENTDKEWLAIELTAAESSLQQTLEVLRSNGIKISPFLEESDQAPVREDWGQAEEHTSWRRWRIIVVFGNEDEVRDFLPCNSFFNVQSLGSYPLRLADDLHTVEELEQKV